jgi:hypothetical protein
MNLEQLQQDFQALPAEAQTLLINYLETLKQQYLKPETPIPESTTSPYQKFKESGFIGCVSIEEDLSTTYKQVLSGTIRRTPPPSIAGGGKTLGDLIRPILEADSTP